MARMAKMESCPKCGAALAANLVKLLKTDPENYICPNGGVEKRKDWEKSWGEDFVDAEIKHQLNNGSADYLAWATNKETV